MVADWLDDPAVERIPNVEQMTLRQLTETTGGQAFFPTAMKDVESDRPDTLAIAAMLPRADIRDRLIGAAKKHLIAEAPHCARPMAAEW